MWSYLANKDVHKTETVLC